MQRVDQERAGAAVDAAPCGLCRADAERIGRAIADVGFPAAKWQLIDGASRWRAPEEHSVERVVRQLWALPAGVYSDAGQVLLAAARTARGHPPAGAPHPPAGAPHRGRPHRDTPRDPGAGAPR